jgi:hypothetical protein
MAHALGLWIGRRVSLGFLLALCSVNGARAARASPAATSLDVDEIDGVDDLDAIADGALAPLGWSDDGISPPPQTWIGLRVADEWVSAPGAGPGQRWSVHVDVAVALDGTARRLPSSRPRQSPPPPVTVPTPSRLVSWTPHGAAPGWTDFAKLARETVAAAERAQGLHSGEQAIDDLEARARRSALLPDLRLRALHGRDDLVRVDTLASGAVPQRSYDSDGARFWVEGRVQWRFDRLLYSGDEPGLERIRDERRDARLRLAHQVVSLLARWMAPPDPSLEEGAGVTRPFEAAALLDVLTAGWFTSRFSRTEAPP